MLTTKLIGATQILLLFALLGLSTGSAGAWSLTAVFAAVMLGTCAHVSGRLLQYAGWSGYFLFTVMFWALPFATLIYMVVPEANLPLITIAAVALLAERFRELKAEQCQLGWIGIPLASSALAIYVQSGNYVVGLNFLLGASAICATAIFYTKLPRFGNTLEVPKLARREARIRARSVGRAA
jgi:hypothetical protein